MSTFIAVPARPTEIKLPVELLYTDASFDCSAGSPSSSSASISDDRLTRIRNHFRSAVQSHIKLHSSFVPTLADCIVDSVEVRCHVTSVSGSSSDQKLVNSDHDVTTILPSDVSRRRRRRRSRHHTSSTTTSTPHSSSFAASSLPTPISTAAEPMRRRATTSRKDRKSRRTTAAAAPTDADVSSSSGSSQLSIQFNLATRLSSGNNPWQDEYHGAVLRLRVAYDYLEQQLLSGNFRLESSYPELVGLHEIKDSLSDAPLRIVCRPGYSFNQAKLLCGEFCACSIFAFRTRPFAINFFCNTGQWSYMNNN